MRTLTTFLIIWGLFIELKPQTDITEAGNETIIYNNCAEKWPDAWRKHQLCTDYEIYAWNDTVIINTRSLLQNWNTFPFNFNGSIKYIIPPPNALAFNLIIQNSLGDTVYNRMTYYQLIGENWSFNIGFLQYVYTLETITLNNPLPGQYIVYSKITANQFTGHTVILFFSIDNPVPVELTTFTAKIIDCNVVLKWVTSTEINNYGFQIERQSQEKIFEVIGFVSGYGNSNSPKFYSFIDVDVLPGNYLYRLKQINMDGSHEYSETLLIAIGSPIIKYILEQNYPNPFNTSTTIKYSLPHASEVELKIYNLLGQEVTTLVNNYQSSGVYEVRFDASGLPTGIYIYQLRAGTFQEIKKMVLLK